MRKASMGSIKVIGLEEVIREFEKRRMDVVAGVEAICMAGAEVIKAEVISRAGDGALGQSIVAETVVRKPTHVTVWVGPNRKQDRFGRYREFGTKPHAIPRARKRGRKVLLFPDGGFAVRVSHPGQKKRPFMRPALDASVNEAAAAMGKKTKEITRS